MFRVLLEILGRNPVIAKLGIAGQLVIFVDDLLRRAAHFARGAGTVKHPVDDIGATRLVAVAVRLVAPRT